MISPLQWLLSFFLVFPNNLIYPFHVFEWKGNLSDSSIWNTGETGDIYFIVKRKEELLEFRLQQPWRLQRQTNVCKISKFQNFKVNHLSLFFKINNQMSIWLYCKFNGITLNSVKTQHGIYLTQISLIINLQRFTIYFCLKFLSVVYFNQLSNAAHTQKLVKVLFWPFSTSC